MGEGSGRGVFEAYLKAANGRDIDALERLLHPDFQNVYPQSGECTRGMANMRAIIEHYPGGYEGQGTGRVVGSDEEWAIQPWPFGTVVHVVGSDDTYTGVSRTRYPDGTEWYIVNVGQLRDGRVWRVETYFAQTFEAPAWRSAWVERIAAEQ